MRAKQNKTKLIIAAAVGIIATIVMGNSINSQKAMVSNLNLKLQQQDSIINDLKQKAENPSQDVGTNMPGAAVIAKSEIKAGTKLSPEMLEIRKFEPSILPANGYTDITVLMGQTASLDIHPGEFITKSNILDITLAGLDLPTGTRAITIPTEYVQGLASYITVGSRIDIFATSKTEGSKPELILQNIKIISLEASPEAVSDKPAAASRSSAITLQVPASAVARLVNAMINGKLQIVMRGFQDNKIINYGSSVGYSRPAYHSKSHIPSIKFELPPPHKEFKGLTSLPEPATPPTKTVSRKVEMIQANVKSEVNFNND